MQEQQIEQGATFLFSPEKIDLTPQIVVDGVDLVSFIKTKQLTKVRKGTYELLNRKGDGRISGTLAKLRDKVDEFAKVTDDDIEKALRILGVGGSGGGHADEQDIKAIAKAIDDYQIAYLMDENKYTYKSGLVYNTVVIDALVTGIEELNVPNGAAILKSQLRAKGRVFEKRGFSARPYDRSEYNILNDRERIIAQCMDVDLSQAEFIPAIDAMFRSVAGDCDINKEVLEKSLLAKWYTTKVLAQAKGDDYNNDYLLRKPPTFIFFAGGSAGRSLFFQQFCGVIFGGDNCATITKSAGTDFNGDMLRKIIVFFNEVKNKNPVVLTEEFKTFIDHQINGVSKGKDGMTIDNIGWYVLTSNGVGSVIIMAGDLNKVDRRWQVVEGTVSLTDILKRVGIVNAGVEEESDTQDIVSRVILNKANIKKHVAWLFEKYQDELTKTDWKVNAVKSPAYFKLCEIQSAAWVKEHFVKYLQHFLKPDSPLLISDLHAKYKQQEWFKESGDTNGKAVLKISKFKEHVITAINTFEELRHYVKYQQKKKMPNGDTEYDVIVISDKAYRDWVDSNYGKNEQSNNDGGDDSYDDIYKAAAAVSDADNDISKALSKFKPDNSQYSSLKF